MHEFRQAVPILAFLIAGCSEATTSPEDVQGVWAGDGVRLSITLITARFESPCYDGELTIPFQYGPDGRFETGGLLTRQGGAPGGDPPTPRFATFTGRVSGDALTLSIAPDDFGLGPYQLQRDAQVNIIGCPLESSLPLRAVH